MPIINTPELIKQIGRQDVPEFNLNPLFTTLFFPGVATFSTRDIALDTLDVNTDRILTHPAKVKLTHPL